MNIVSLNDVTKSYGEVRAVDGLSLTVPDGQVLALLGPNGAGKSTTIAMLLGLTPPDRGTVQLFGTTPERAARQGKVGAMLQSGGLIQRVTITELLTFLASCFERPVPVAQALETAFLTDLADRRVDQLSGGQAQRVRFAMAIIGSPRLLVLDEPTAALDIDARHEFWRGIRSWAQGGGTVLFSTHYLEEADQNADRVVVVDRGTVVADGTSGELKAHSGGSTVAVDLTARTPRDLRSLPGVTDVAVHENRVFLKTVLADATVLELARCGAVSNIEVSAPSLDDAFLALTRKAS